MDYESNLKHNIWLKKCTVLLKSAFTRGSRTKCTNPHIVLWAHVPSTHHLAVSLGFYLRGSFSSTEWHASVEFVVWVFMCKNIDWESFRDFSNSTDPEMYVKWPSITFQNVMWKCHGGIGVFVVRTGLSTLLCFVHSTVHHVLWSVVPLQVIQHDRVC